jgi:hypothetical protein
LIRSLETRRPIIRFVLRRLRWPRPQGANKASEREMSPA